MEIVIEHCKRHYFLVLTTAEYLSTRILSMLRCGRLWYIWHKNKIRLLYAGTRRFMTKEVDYSTILVYNTEVDIATSFQEVILC